MNKKIIVTLKEPISNGVKMIDTFSCDSVYTGEDHAGIIIFEIDETFCYFPAHNVLGTFQNQAFAQ